MYGDNGWIIFCVVIAFLFGLLISWAITISVGIDISQETADEICVNLTGIEGTFAGDRWNDDDAIFGALYCKTPTWDETSNIIIQTNE